MIFINRKRFDHWANGLSYEKDKRWGIINDVEWKVLEVVDMSGGRGRPYYQYLIELTRNGNTYWTVRTSINPNPAMIVKGVLEQSIPLYLIKPVIGIF